MTFINPAFHMHMHSTEVLAALTELWFDNYSKRLTLLLNRILRNFLSCTETVKATRLKLCHFSEQLSEHIFVKTLMPRPFGNEATSSLIYYREFYILNQC